jgi:ABC-type multidrug transport system permease subunit
MLRAVWLTIGKEFRLIRRDRVGMFMLLVAPIAVIAAAGFSLARVYGGEPGVRTGYAIAFVDEDHREIAHAIRAALAREPALKIIDASNRGEAQSLVRERKAAVVGIVVPAGATSAVEQGGSARIFLYTDPVKYLQTVRIELMLSALCRKISAGASDHARSRARDQVRDIQAQIERARASAAAASADAARLSEQAAAARVKIAAQIRAQVEAAIAKAREHAKAALDAELDRVQRTLESETAAQQAKLDQLKDYLQRLEVARGQFENWLDQLKQSAGSRASSIPPPPAFPTPPANLDLEKVKIEPSVDLKSVKRNLESALTAPPINIEVPSLAPPKIPKFDMPDLSKLDGGLTIPGTVGFVELDRNGRESAAIGGFNAFDLQVPGFAVTFLLIGMLMGVSLALIDEREWGTLERLRSAWAPLWTTLTGKLLARFVVGFVQMVVLFVAGWALFGISLGRAPAALMMPAAAIAFAGAAFGLIVAGVGRTRDAVLPVGAIVIMTMAAIGGCWWPIDFEPSWMQQVALALPTTWAMRAFNDLMIRELSPASVLIPTAINFGFGLVYTIIGVAIARRRFG